MCIYLAVGYLPNKNDSTDVAHMETSYVGILQFHFFFFKKSRCIQHLIRKKKLHGISGTDICIKHPHTGIEEMNKSIKDKKKKKKTGEGELHDAPSSLTIHNLGKSNPDFK